MRRWRHLLLLRHYFYYRRIKNVTDMSTSRPCPVVLVVKVDYGQEGDFGSEEVKVTESGMF
jgi:hypothetical protein